MGPRPVTALQTLPSAPLAIPPDSKKKVAKSKVELTAEVKELKKKLGPLRVGPRKKFGVEYNNGKEIAFAVFEKKAEQAQAMLGYDNIKFKKPSEDPNWLKKVVEAWTDPGAHTEDLDIIFAQDAK